MNLVTLANLTEAKCDLCGMQAVDCLVQYMGYEGENNIEEVQDEFHVYICEFCSKMVTSGLWVLLYCFNCHDFRFIHKPSAKRHYESDFNLIKKCPTCRGE